MKEQSLEGETLHIVNLHFPFPFNRKPYQTAVLGIWDRDEERKTEVYAPGKREGWRAAFNAEFGQSPNGIDQTKLVLEQGKVEYIRSFVVQGLNAK